MNTEKTQTAAHSCCSDDSAGAGEYVDPICGMSVSGGVDSLHWRYGETTYYFCSDHCLDVFQQQKLGKIVPVSGKHRSLLYGLLGCSALLLVFLLVVYLATDSSYAFLSELSRLWYWALILSAGFGFQLGLYVYIRQFMQQRMTGATAEVAASGAISTGSMIACCSHGLVNLLPILGISAAAAFLARFQLPLLLLGVFSNLVGVTIMLGIAKKYSISFNNRLLTGLTRMNIKVARTILIVVGVVSILWSAIAA